VKLSIVTAASIAALAATSLSAHAGCADPRHVPGSVPPKMPHFVLQAPAHDAGDRGAANSIVGTWVVNYTVEGNPFGTAYIQWHNDGTEWENIDLPIPGGNICMGSWVQVDGKHVSRYHVGWLYTDGTLSGYFTETETDKVARDGMSYAGTNEQKVYDLDGNLLADVTGTSSAVKITP
jgi:hypothetical protein